LKLDSRVKLFLLKALYMNDISSSFIATLTRSLGNRHLDFHEKLTFIQDQNKDKINYLSAGVCIPIFYDAGQFYIQLIKRSLKVSQPGDLSFPGGMLSPMKDNLLECFISWGFIPIMRRNKHLFLNHYESKVRRIIKLFLASALREAWEEIRMNPCRLIYLGPLPTYTLKMFRRVIFPSVCFIQKQSKYRLNDEVERIINIPLRLFFDEGSYFRLAVEMPERGEQGEEFPCLLFRERNGTQEHILWGATFYLIMNLLEIVYNLQVPPIPESRTIKKTLLANYHHS